MSKEKVLTETEIENVKKVREDFQILVGRIGEVEIGILNLQKNKKTLEVELDRIQQEEIRIAKELEIKYGKGNVSLETGTFPPVE